MNTITDATVKQASAMSTALWSLLSGRRLMPDNLQLCATGTAVETAWLSDMGRLAQEGVTTIALLLDLHDDEVTLHSILVFRPCGRTPGKVSVDVCQPEMKPGGMLSLRTADKIRPLELTVSPCGQRLVAKRVSKPRFQAGARRIEALGALLAEAATFAKLDPLVRWTD